MDVDEDIVLFSKEEKANDDIYIIKSDEKDQKCVVSSITQMPAQYLPSFNSGFCGHYNYTPVTKKYLPSLNSGIFGTWIYNENTSLKTKSQELYEQSFLATGKEFRKIHRDIEQTVNGYRFNVELISEWKIPISNQTTNNNNSEKDLKTNLKKMVKTAKKKKCSDFGIFYISSGSCVTFTGECIVNAANEGMLGGGGIDGAITSTGGRILRKLRVAVPIVNGSHYVRCKTGDAKITLSGHPYNRYKCDFIIHAVGPSYGYSGYDSDDEDEDEDPYAHSNQLLYDCYAKTMQIACEYDVKSIGICLISSGIFRGPQSLKVVLEIGVRAICDHMYAGVEVHFIGYTQNELRTLFECTPNVLGKPHVSHSVIKKKVKSSWNFGFVSSFTSSFFTSEPKKSRKRKKPGESLEENDNKSGIGEKAEIDDKKVVKDEEERDVIIVENKDVSVDVDVNTNKNTHMDVDSDTGAIIDEEDEDGLKDG